jgi:hypothetical protein
VQWTVAGPPSELLTACGIGAISGSSPPLCFAVYQYSNNHCPLSAKFVRGSQNGGTEPKSSTYLGSKRWRQNPTFYRDLGRRVFGTSHLCETQTWYQHVGTSCRRACRRQQSGQSRIRGKLTVLGSIMLCLIVSPCALCERADEDSTAG